MTQIASVPGADATLTAPSAPRVRSAGPVSLEPWRLGAEVLGGYTVEGELGRGEGAFGQVYLLSVKAPELRRYAVKRLLLADDVERRMFLRELQTWIDLPEHPNLVTFRFPRLEDEVLYMFADYIDGGSLVAWMEERKRVWNEEGTATDVASILDIAIQFAWGLQACHAWGITHGDVKPANSLMTRGGTVKVGDFGLSRSRVAGAGEAGYPLGTRYYRSPEQAAHKQLTAYTDLWSFGASVLQLFTGHYPSGEATDQDLEGYASGDLKAQPWLPAMPGEVVEALRECLRRDDPSERGSALDMANALYGICRHLTGHDPGPQPEFCPAAERVLESHDRRNRAGAQWSDARSLLISLVGDNRAQELLLPREGLGRRAQAVADLAAYEEAQRAVEHRLAQVNYAHAELEVVEGRELALSNTAQSGWELLARVLMEKALIHEQVDDTPGELRQYERAVAIYEQLVKARPTLASELALASMNKGTALLGQGKIAEATASYDRATAMHHALRLRPARSPPVEQHGSRPRRRR